ncbi:MAG: CRISPR-associated endoribonuclease Cas6 [Ignavibacteria bacterium]|nr:CRISPR-associated endoribonuclease Cas6 [Ignavibacteria bacterium]
MRIKLYIKPLERNSLVPINYQYYLSSFIYRTIEASNSDYSKWLHDSGFMSGNKRFKYFTFSMLNIPEREIVNDFIKIKSHQIELTVSMLSLESMNHLIIGLFESCRFNIKDYNFIVKYAEKIPDPIFRDEMIFKTISPVIISKVVEYNGKPSERYMKPDESEYADFLKKNLEEKYLTYCMSCGIKVNGHGVDSFDLIECGNSKLITIRQNRAEETKVKAYPMTFRLKGNPDIIKIAYEAGVGKLCSLGFGCIKSLN